MRNPKKSRTPLHPLRQSRVREAILHLSPQSGPHSQTPLNPFPAVAPGQARPSAYCRCYSIDVNGTRYYFHQDLKRAVIITHAIL